MTCDLGVVLEIAGGLSATALAFIVCPHLVSVKELMIVPRFSIFRLDKRTLVLSCQTPCGDLYRIWDYCINPKLWLDTQQGVQWRRKNKTMLDMRW
jgi:hypothetical protein